VDFLSQYASIEHKPWIIVSISLLFVNYFTEYCQHSERVLVATASRTTMPQVINVGIAKSFDATSVTGMRSSLAESAREGAFHPQATPAGIEISSRE